MTALCTASSIQTYSVINQSVQSGTYTLISGIANQSIKVRNFIVNCSPGTVTLQDSQGVYIGGPFNGGSINNSFITLSTGADFQAIISSNSILSVMIDAYFGILPRSQSSVQRALNTPFQISTLQDSLVHYSVDIASTLTLVTGQVGTILLQISNTSDFSGTVQELGRVVNGNAGTLTIGLNLTQTLDPPLAGFVPAGYWVRLLTQNTTGTPTFTFRSGQEVLL